MLQVTPEARTELHAMLLQTKVDEVALPEPPELGFRLIAKGTELGLALDEVRDQDEVVRHDGRSILILDALAAELLQGLTLDIVEMSDGPRLALRD